MRAEFRYDARKPPNFQYDALNASETMPMMPPQDKGLLALQMGTSRPQGERQRHQVRRVGRPKMSHARD